VKPLTQCRRRFNTSHRAPQPSLDHRILFYKSGAPATTNEVGPNIGAASHWKLAIDKRIGQLHNVAARDGAG
jgi:hypothetical protein